MKKQKKGAGIEDAIEKKKIEVKTEKKKVVSSDDESTSSEEEDLKKVLTPSSIGFKKFFS